MARKTKKYVPATNEGKSFSFGSFGTGGYTGYQSISERQALSISTVWRCISLIAGSMSTIPLEFFEVGALGRSKKVDHDYWYLLNEQANPEYCSSILRESMIADMLLHGDGFVEAVRASRYANKVEELYWHSAEQTVTARMKTGEVVHFVKNPIGDYRPVQSADMLQITGNGFNGLRGVSAIKHTLRSQVAIAEATNDHSEAFFANGTRPEYSIQFPEHVTLKDKDIADIQAMLAAKHGGAKNNNKPLILSRGGTINEVRLSQADNQLLESRAFQVDDIARFFGVPGVMVGSPSASSWGTGIEQLGIFFVQYTLRPIATKLEQELNRKLFLTNSKLRVKLDLSDLMRGDLKSSIEAARSALGRAGEDGILSTNEARAKLGYEPIPGFDEIKKATMSTPNV